MHLTIHSSQPRVNPEYSDELQHWRAKLRPFLARDGRIASARPLESLSGEQLNQDAVNLAEIGEQRRLQLYDNFLQKGRLPSHRPRQQPVPISLEPSAEVVLEDGLLESANDDLSGFDLGDELPCG